LAGALLFDEKIRQSAAPFWFRLRDVGILKIFYSQVVIQRRIVGAGIGGKDQKLCPEKP
jgi:hypothetical protein